ncbi:hypothetical protein HRbin37_01748 [bacterium HR37]|nr:hypothetical protein HRbin37_01748 [bacterium HR37]
MSRLKILSKLLEIKKNNLEKYELDLRKTRYELHLEEEKLENLKNKLKESSNLYNDNQVSIGELELIHNYIEALTKETKERKRTLEIKEKEFEEKKNQVLSIYRESKLIELLGKKIQFEEEKKKAIREQQWIDFISLLKKVNR